MYVKEFETMPLGTVLYLGRSWGGRGDSTLLLGIFDGLERITNRWSSRAERLVAVVMPDDKRRLYKPALVKKAFPDMTMDEVRAQFAAEDAEMAERARLRQRDHSRRHLVDEPILVTVFPASGFAVVEGHCQPVVIALAHAEGELGVDQVYDTDDTAWTPEGLTGKDRELAIEAIARHRDTTKEET